MDTTLHYLSIIMVCFCSTYVQRVSGFGSGIFAMLFLPYLMPSSAAAAATSGLFSMPTTLYNAFHHRKHLQFKIIFPLLCAALITIPFAVSFSVSAPEALMKQILGIVLIVLSIYFLFFDAKIHFKPTVGTSIGAGALGGVLGGMFATGGPPAVLYLIHATDDKLSYFAAIQLYFAVTGIYSTVIRMMNGIIDQTVLLSAAVGFIGSIFGHWLGNRTFDRLDSEKLKSIIYLGMIISGILMII